MFTKNIKFKNFYGKKNITLIKKLSNIFIKEDWIAKYPLLNSLNKNYNYSYNKKEISRYKKFSSFNLIGMGGSILGSEAIYQFLNHKIKKNFYFYNNLQNKNFLKSNKKKINIVISKSGNTLETICNFNLLMKKQNKNKNIIITEKKNSFLSLLAKKLKAEIFEHKNFIGGRYSVLSEVGMLPAELMGLNQEKFKKYNELIKKKSFINLLIENVSFISSYLAQGKCNSVILNYDEKSNNLFRWYQQLTAESLGKKSKGIFPIISTMPKDNHSLLQLYLDGPKNNFFTFFEVKDQISNKLNKNSLFNNFNFLKEKKLSEIISSQKKATENVFKKKNIPFRSFEILNRNEETLGELFCFFILETILLSRLLKVNPLNQPSIELIKTETKKVLI